MLVRFTFNVIRWEERTLVSDLFLRAALAAIATLSLYKKRSITKFEKTSLSDDAF